jgi:hypothetical protein
LAYVYLTEHETEAAHQLMQNALLNFLRYHGIGVSKYHETMTRGVDHGGPTFHGNLTGLRVVRDLYRQQSEDAHSKIMMTHYSAEVLFSDEARARFVEPNLSPIPRYGS